jgi:amidase
MIDKISESNGDPISRRTLLGLAAATSVSGMAHAAPKAIAPVAHTNDLVMMDATSLASAIHTRRASCVEVMTAYLDHIEKFNPKVNAIVALQDRAELLAQARERDASWHVANQWGRCTDFRTP